MPAGIRITSPMILSAIVPADLQQRRRGGQAELSAGSGLDAADHRLGLGALSLLQLVLELRVSRGAYEEQIDLRKDLPIYLWVWAFVLAVVAFGFVIAAPLMLFAYLRWRSARILVVEPAPAAGGAGNSLWPVRDRRSACRCSKAW